MNPTPEGSSQSPYLHDQYANTSYTLSGSPSQGSNAGPSHASERGYTKSTQYTPVPDDSTGVGPRQYAPAENLAQHMGGLSMSFDVAYESQKRYPPATVFTHGQDEEAYTATGQSTYETSASMPGSHCVYLCTLPTCPFKFDSIRERDRHFTTVHSNNGERPHRCFVVGCQARVTSWTRLDKLKEHNKNWHGPYACTVSSCSRGLFHGFRSQTDLDLHRRESHGLGDYGNEAATQNLSSSPYSASISHETSMVPQPNLPMTGLDSMSTKVSSPVSNHRIEISHSLFKLYPSKHFKIFRVFKVLWSEPVGFDDDSSITHFEAETSRRKSAFQKIRRFIIIKTFAGHSLCLPIMTYGGQGTRKHGVHRQDHAIVYSTDHPPDLLPGEQELDFRPIKMVPQTPRDRLAPESRVNFAKVYTVEHNIMVQFIGNIDERHEGGLIMAFDTVSTQHEQGFSNNNSDELPYPSNAATSSSSTP